MLGAIESLMSAVVADRMTGDRHNPNVELIAQGIANMSSPLVGGLPATGAIARQRPTSAPARRTPVAGIMHALTLLAILLFAAPLAGAHPAGRARRHPAGGRHNMGEWGEIPSCCAGLDRSAVWLVTFVLTVFADLTVAVEVGHDPGGAALHPQASRRRRPSRRSPRTMSKAARAHPPGQNTFPTT